MARVDDKYKERLSEWVEAQRKKLEAAGETPSWSRLETEIILKTGKPIDRATLSNWERGEYKRAIDGEKLAALAAYRGETVNQCRSWLEGKSEEPGNGVGGVGEVLEWIAQSHSIDDLVEVSVQAMKRVQSLTVEKSN